MWHQGLYFFAICIANCIFAIVADCYNCISADCSESRGCHRVMWLGIVKIY